jgi:hypothetical protein
MSASVRRAVAGAVAAVALTTLLAASPAIAGTAPGGGGLRPDLDDRPTTTDADRDADTDTEDSTPTTAAGGALRPELDAADAGAADDDGGDGTSPVVLAGIGLVGLVLGAAAGTALTRRGSAPAPAGGPAPQPVHAPSTPAPVAPAPATPAGDPAVAEARDRAVEQRALLVQTIIDVGDQVSSEAVRAQLAESLQRVGVVPHRVDAGTPFDPHRHRGVQAVPAATAEANGTVAACDRPGWVDGEHTIRLPEVVVYRWEDPS